MLLDQGVVTGIDTSAKSHLENTMMNYFVANLPIIGVGTMHNYGGYVSCTGTGTGYCRNGWA
jgi:hypothetical protein